MGREEASRTRVAGWAAVVCAATIVLAIGAPLLGRGVLIGVDVVHTVPPWSAETPSSFVYRHGGINDTVDVGAPARDAIRRALVDEHHLPLWDPYPNGGGPLGSTPNSGILAPITWPQLLLGVGTGAAWAALLRLAVAALGMFLLLRRLGVSRFAAVCGGLIYCTSGFLLAWNNWPQADMAAMTPLLFLAADVLRERRRVVDVLAVAAVVAAMFLEGYLPLLLVLIGALAVFLLVRWWEASRGTDPERPPLWSRVRTAIGPTGLLVAGCVLGAALVAFLLVPFARGLGAYDLTYRQHNSTRVLPPFALLTSAFPWAQGSPAHPDSLTVLNPEVRRFTVNFIEQFAFLGAAAVVMALWAVLRGRPTRVGRGVYWYCVGGTLFLLLVLFGTSVGPLPDLGGALTDVLYAVPGVEQVPIARFVAPLLFLATMVAAFGIEHLAGPEPPALRFDRRFALRTGAVLVVLAYLLYRPLRQQLTLLVDRTSTDYWGSTVVHVASQRSWILRNSIGPALIVLAAIAIIVVARRGPGAPRTVALACLPVLLAVEGLLVSAQMLPRVERSDYYPRTGVIRYLQAHDGHERIAPAGRSMLYYATNSMYGLRSVAGHSLTARPWHELLAATKPEYQLMLNTRLAQTADAATSPVLDRLAARFFVAAPDAVPFGSVEAPPPATSSVRVGDGRTAAATIAPGPLRAVEVRVLGRERLRGDLVDLDVTVRAPSGAVLARGSRRLVDQRSTTAYFVAIPGENLPATMPLRVELGLRSDARDTVELGANADGSVNLGLIRPTGDGLRLTYAGSDGVVYRRLHALPRVRWASRATVQDPFFALQSLVRGAPDDTVILGRKGPAADGAPASVHIRHDSADKIEVRVDAAGAGYLVVADSIQSGWQARLDGRPVPLRPADVALVAVHVPKGRHTVELTASPEGWHLGIAISLAALAVVVGLVGWVVLAGRRRRRGRGGPPPAGDGVDPGAREPEERPDPVRTGP